MHRSIVHVLLSTAAKKPNAPALRYKKDGRWWDITWASYARRVRLVARGLIGLGLGPGDAVSIVGRNCPEWLIADLAAIAAGGVPAPLYPNCTPDQARYIIEHCEASVLIADGSEQIAKIRGSGVGGLEHCVQMQGDPAEGAMALEGLERLGEEVSESVLEERLAGLEPRGLATLIYTSGTTGPPKGVMLCNENLVWTAEAVREALDATSEERILSYLPLSHIAEQMVSIHLPVTFGITVAFAESLERLGDNLREIRPTFFLAVPRVWEKIQAKMTAAGKDSSPLKKRIVAWARGVGLEAGRRAERRGSPPLGHFLAQKLVFSKVRERLGLDRCKRFYSTAAPIARGTLEFFFSLGIPIYEVYGMTEVSGPGTVSRSEAYRIGKAGPPLPGTEIKIAADGEICMRGKHTFLGYYKEEAATDEALDEEGWVHSGDIGELDDEGFLSVTDRKKDLIITAGGKNIAPQNLEALLKGIPGLGQACVIGDKRKYLTALFTVDRETGPQVASECGARTSAAEELAEDPAFRSHVQRHLDEINDTLASFETIKKFTILPAELTVESGELTPTMKMKRNVVCERYDEQIREMYPAD